MGLNLPGGDWLGWYHRDGFTYGNLRGGATLGSSSLKPHLDRQVNEGSMHTKRFACSNVSGEIERTIAIETRLEPKKRILAEIAHGCI